MTTTYEHEEVFLIITRVIVNIYIKRCANEHINYYVPRNEISKGFTEDKEGMKVSEKAWAKYKMLHEYQHQASWHHQTMSSLVLNMIAFFSKEYTEEKEGRITPRFTLLFDRKGDNEKTYSYRPREWRDIRTKIKRKLGDYTKKTTTTPQPVSNKNNDQQIAAEKIRQTETPLNENIPPSPDANDLATPERITQTIHRIIRDTNLARIVKYINNYECQICGKTIELAGKIRYAEAHHIKPLGSPHNGPDVIGNILCLCPNHHVLLDYGAMRLDMTRIRTSNEHKISPEYVQYYNSHILKSR